VTFALDAAARAKRNINLGSWLTGTLPVKLKAPLSRTSAEVEIDLTPAGIDNPVPGVSKPAGKPGKATFVVKPAPEGSSLSNVAIDLGAPMMRGSAQMGADGQIASATITQARIAPGDDFKADVVNNQSLLKISVRGTTLDGRVFVKSLFDGTPTGQPPAKDLDLDVKMATVAGANKQDYHVKNLTPGVTFQPTAYADLRNVEAGDICPNCDGTLHIDQAVEIGHIFKLGYKYSESMGARVLDHNGKEVAPIMGSYGIGIERILTAAIEQANDADGFWLPPQIAPFEIVVTPTNTSDTKLLDVATEIVRQLEAAGFDVLLDDRDERPGVKFKDADLVGIPYRVTVGKKVTEDRVEVVTRSTHQVQDVSIGAVTPHFQQLLRPAL